MNNFTYIYLTTWMRWTPFQQKKGGHGKAHQSFQHRPAVQASLGKNQDLIFKITRAKRAGGIAQAVEHLPRKHETLSSNHQKNCTYVYKHTYMLIYMYVYVYTHASKIFEK
jgi:hypothetical protein